MTEVFWPALGSLAASAVAWKCVRSSVNCWFCHGDAVTWRWRANSWFCPSCCQYNGFTKDGGYNQPVPGQAAQEADVSVDFGLPSQDLGMGNVLCLHCNFKQGLKIDALRNFTPSSELAYDEELSRFKASLEEVFPLCPQCSLRVNDLLRRLDSKFSKDLIQTRWQRANRPPQISNSQKPSAKSRLKAAFRDKLTVSQRLLRVLHAVTLQVFIVFLPSLEPVLLNSLRHWVPRDVSDPLNVFTGLLGDWLPINNVAALIFAALILRSEHSGVQVGTCLLLAVLPIWAAEWLAPFVVLASLFEGRHLKTLLTKPRIEEEVMLSRETPCVRNVEDACGPKDQVFVSRSKVTMMDDVEMMDTSEDVLLPAVRELKIGDRFDALNIGDFVKRNGNVFERFQPNVLPENVENRDEPELPRPQVIRRLVPRPSSICSDTDFPSSASDIHGFNSSRGDDDERTVSDVDDTFSLLDAPRKSSGWVSFVLGSVAITSMMISLFLILFLVSADRAIELGKWVSSGW